uniref:Ribosomal protein S7 n=1 Tax=Prototheca wickerhamii TaxID=3111 RepID=A0A873HW62_PROWI|nr:ribosomal protein S7 [Prototheca wickerhamii]QOZ41701.1 ribosomal protein S7 [Prototheca wickerhamii]
MSRRRTEKRRNIPADPLYKSIIVELFVRQIMRKGKKTLAYSIIYKSMFKIREITKEEPLIIIEQAILNVKPLLETRARRSRGSVKQIPIEVKPERGILLAIRWIKIAAQKNKGKPMFIALANELINASNNTGNAVRKKDETHKMAEANKTFIKRKY